MKFTPMKTDLFSSFGAQLYTVREALATEAARTISAIAEMGYSEVELHDLTQADRLAPIISANGLELIASHFWPGYITGRWDILAMFGLPVPENKSFEYVLEQAVKHGIGNVVLPMLFPQERGDAEHYRVLAEKFNTYGEQCRAAGLRFCYHNHAFELEPLGGTTPLEIFLNGTDPGLVHFELDAFWVAITGADPVTVLEEHPGRFSILHLKDLKRGTPSSFNEVQVSMESPEVFQPLGQGILDFPGILSTAQKMGISHCIVELDHTSGNPLEALRNSFEYLQSL